MLEDISAVLCVPFQFGLRSQGHISTVERMLAEGKSWQEIGDAIGWDGNTAERFWGYELERRHE